MRSLEMTRAARDQPEEYKIVLEQLKRVRRYHQTSQTRIISDSREQLVRWTAFPIRWIPTV